ncbi:Ribokinase-like protein [Xylaria cubensis]|nr:Ribokinase-like protein [Xylaria cubensis]
MAINLVCVGACYLDTILSVPHYPAEDSKLRASSLQVRRGGNCPNTLEVLQQLLQQEQGNDEIVKVRPYLVTCLPSRHAPATMQIIESFGVDSPVDFSRCLFRDEHEQPASSYIIRSSETGSRTLVNYNELAEMSFHEFVAAAESVGGEDAWFHFEGRIPATTLQCIQWLRRSKPKARVSVEIEKPGREGLDELVAEADVVFFSRSWAESNLYTSAEKCLRAQSAKARKGSHLFCTWGSQGAAGSSPDGTTMSCSAAQPDQTQTIHVIDTIGAGDTFIAGILFGFLQHSHDWDTGTKLSFAVQLATCKVQQEGFNDLGSKALRCVATARVEVDK